MMMKCPSWRVSNSADEIQVVVGVVNVVGTVSIVGVVNVVIGQYSGRGQCSGIGWYIDNSGCGGILTIVGVAM